MKRKGISLLSMFFALVMIIPASAWNNHALVAYPALQNTIASDVQVLPEELTAFITAEKDKIATLLDEEEIWARANVKNYAPRPDALRFSTSTEQDIKIRFYKAIRINPNFLAKLYIQKLPAFNVTGPELPWKDISLFPAQYIFNPYIAISEKNKVQAIAVIATACDEPDYGADLALWEDNGSAWGKEYKFGVQPFGNPKFVYSSQAPFHMAFYHESSLLTMASPSLKTAYPTLRIHLYQSLARLAFATGHDYWGYRFAGWGLHYIQDMTSPYHMRVVPNRAACTLVFAGGLNAIGLNGFQDKILAEISNMHYYSEQLESQMLEEEIFNKTTSRTLITALSSSGDDTAGHQYNDSYPIQVISMAAYKQSARLGKTLDKAITDRALFNSIPELDAKGVWNAFDMIKGTDPKNMTAINNMYSEILSNTGFYTRLYFKSIKK